MTRSLRTTLLCWLGIPLLLMLPVTAAVQYWLAIVPAGQVLDHEIGNVTLALAPHVRFVNGRAEFDINAEADASLRSDDVDSILYTVLDPSGRPLVGDRVLADPPLSLQAGEVRLYYMTIGNAKIRVAARGVTCGPGVCQVRAAETSVNRSHIEASVLGTTLVAMLVLAAIALLGLLSAIHGGLKRLTALSDQLATRSLDDLRPLDANEVPKELSGVVGAVNRLFDRLRSASLAQQAFLADAAHQLRTPLATMRTETDLAILEPHSAEMHPMLVRLQDAAERASRLSTQLLALARSDPAAAAALVSEPMDLKDIGGNAAREWAPRAMAVGADIGFDLQEGHIVGRPFQMRELLNNLIHNALEYGGHGVQITVKCATEGDRVILQVEDDGPGIPPEEREKVLNRFYRCPGSKGNGSGLGLAIVNEIVAAHGATITIDTPTQGRGTLIRMAFPRVEAPAKAAAPAPQRRRDTAAA